MFDGSQTAGRAHGSSGGSLSMMLLYTKYPGTLTLTRYLDLDVDG